LPQYTPGLVRFYIFYIKNDGKIEKFFIVLSTNMSSPKGTPRVLVFDPIKNGVQTSENSDLYVSEMDKVLQSAPVVQSVSPHSDLNCAKLFFTPFFLALLVKIAGFETTLLLIELEFTRSSLVDHFFFWKEINFKTDWRDMCFSFYRSFTCIILFDCAFITVRKNDESEFSVTYQTFDNPRHFGNPLNGAFPREGSDPEDEPENFVELLPFCSPMTLKNAEEEDSYTFARLKVYIDPKYWFMFFSFLLLSFDDGDVDDRELDDDSDFEMMKINLSLPIRFCESISSTIVFAFSNSGYYAASFTIKIGDEHYKVLLEFDKFKQSCVDHYAGHYVLSAISDSNTCTTFFCCYADAEELMEHGMPRVGVLSIKIPVFVPPKTDDDSALENVMRDLPEDLRTFLTSITWHNPEAAGTTESN